MSRTTWCAVAVAALVWTSVAQAQPGGGRQGRGPGGFGGPGGGDMTLPLLNAEKVQKELNVVDEQKEKIKKLAEESQAATRELFSGLRDLSEEERRAKFEELRKKGEEQRKELKKKVEEVLLPAQVERLKQIRIQVVGLAALNEEDIAKELGINEEQKKKMADVREEVGKQMRELFQGGRGQSEEERTQAREKLNTLRKDSEEKTLAVLSAEQREKFEKMKGEKFEIDARELFRGGRGQGGPGGGQRGNRPQPNNAT